MNVLDIETSALPRVIAGHVCATSDHLESLLCVYMVIFYHLESLLCVYMVIFYHLESLLCMCMIIVCHLECMLETVCVHVAGTFVNRCMLQNVF